MNASAKGKLVIISGPSGAGKSTVLKELIDSCHLPLELSVSATTRAPRPGEKDGIEYHFMSRDEFAGRRQRNEFLECKEVYGRGDWYGTLDSTVTAGLGAGKWVILEIDVEGALTVLTRHPEAITVFLHSGSEAELERRLRSRGTESEASIQRRLDVARRELSVIDKYDHQVVNQTVSQAAREICEILTRYAEPS